MEDQTILFHRSRSCDVSSSSTPGARSCERRPSFNIKRRIVADSVKRTMEESHDLKLSSPKSNGGFGADTTAANRSSGKRSPNSLDRGIQQRSPNGLQRIASSRQQDAETLSADLSNSIQYSSPKTSFNFDGISLADIQHSSTFDSSDGSESEIIGFDENDVATEYATNNRRESIGQYACSTSQASDSLRININEELSESVAEQQRCPDLSWSEWLHHASYISTLGILGTVLRMYMERFFGLDCEMKSSKPVNDFFERISSNVCVTASGTTNQTGGALFTSLPANMLGCFFMGLVNPVIPGRSPPGLPPNHPLQNSDALHVGITFGFCGCLTTFSSWNTQMVVMMDGTGTELGPQVLSALFGYMIGVACAVASFQCGRNVAEWVESRHPCRLSPINSVEEGPAANDDLNNYCGDKRQRVKTWRMHPGYLCCNVSYGSLFLVIILFVAFLVGDFVAANAFYRKMWMTVALTPFGAIIRWRLGNMNGKGLSAFHLEWFPVGTFMCNVEAAAISIIAVALLGGKLANQNNAAIIQPWIDPLLDSIGAGFAGSLSTVSTLVKEMAVLSSPAQRHGYCLATILCSMLISILFYRPVWHAVS